MKGVEDVCISFLSLAGINLSGFEGLIVILFILGIALVIVELIMPGIVCRYTGYNSLIAGIVLAAQVVSTATLVLIITVVLLIIAGMLIFHKSATKRQQAFQASFAEYQDRN